MNTHHTSPTPAALEMDKLTTETEGCTRCDGIGTEDVMTSKGFAKSLTGKRLDETDDVQTEPCSVCDGHGEITRTWDQNHNLIDSTATDEDVERCEQEAHEQYAVDCIRCDDTGGVQDGPGSAWSLCPVCEPEGEPADTGEDAIVAILADHYDLLGRADGRMHCAADGCDYSVPMSDATADYLRRHQAVLILTVQEATYLDAITREEPGR